MVNNKIPTEIREGIVEKLAKKYYDKNEGWTWISDVIRLGIREGFKAGQKQERDKVFKLIDELKEVFHDEAHDENGNCTYFMSAISREELKSKLSGGNDGKED